MDRADAMTLAAFQAAIEATYGERDAARGLAPTYMWFVEEVGELGRALRKGEAANLQEEIGDVLAWLTTLASMAGVSLEAAARRYLPGCPRCGASPCACQRGPARS